MIKYAKSTLTTLRMFIGNGTVMFVFYLTKNNESISPNDSILFKIIRVIFTITRVTKTLNLVFVLFVFSQFISLCVYCYVLLSKRSSFYSPRKDLLQSI